MQSKVVAHDYTVAQAISQQDLGWAYKCATETMGLTHDKAANRSGCYVDMPTSRLDA